MTRSEVGTLADSLLGGASGLSIDKMGVVFAGTFDERVYKIRLDGQKEVLASGQFGATGNTVGPMGDLFQLNFFGGYVTRIDRHGTPQILASGLETPMDITFADGNFYVANCGSNAISRVTLDGEVSIFKQGPPFNCPNGLTFASDGNLYVVNFSDASLLKLTLDGEISVFETLPHFQNVIASARGYLYVASGSGRQVHRISLSTKEVSHIAGTGERGSNDGDALDATFFWPNGIAAWEGGMIFINDLQTRAAPERWKTAQSLGTVRVLSLPSLTDYLSDLYVAEGAEAMVNAYKNYRLDPATAGLLDEAEVNGWGYDTLPVLPDAGLKIFQLNAESYPNSWRAQNGLGDAYMKIGQPEEAISAFERSLEINPDNPYAANMIEQLRTRE